MKNTKEWIFFMCEVCDKIHDEKDRELVRKRLTKKTQMFYKIIKAEIKEIKLLKK